LSTSSIASLSCALRLPVSWKPIAWKTSSSSWGRGVPLASNLYITVRRLDIPCKVVVLSCCVRFRCVWFVLMYLSCSCIKVKSSRRLLLFLAFSLCCFSFSSVIVSNCVVKAAFMSLTLVSNSEARVVVVVWVTSSSLTSMVVLLCWVDFCFFCGVCFAAVRYGNLSSPCVKVTYVGVLLFLEAGRRGEGRLATAGGTSVSQRSWQHNQQFLGRRQCGSCGDTFLGR